MCVMIVGKTMSRTGRSRRRKEGGKEECNVLLHTVRIPSPPPVVQRSIHIAGRTVAPGRMRDRDREEREEEIRTVEREEGR